MKCCTYRFEIYKTHGFNLFVICTLCLIYGCKGTSSDENSAALDSLKKRIEMPPALVDTPTPSPEEKSQEILNKQFNNNKPLERAAEGIPLSKDGKMKPTYITKLKRDSSMNSQ